jgi:hypothetical protein
MKTVDEVRVMKGMMDKFDEAWQWHLKKRLDENVTANTLFITANQMLDKMNELLHQVERVAQILAAEALAECRAMYEAETGIPYPGKETENV